MKHIIDKINQIDKAIVANEQKIQSIAANEKHLHQALEIAKEKESEVTKLFTQNPTTEHQENLDASRDFTQSCQRKVNLFTDNTGNVKVDIKDLQHNRKNTIKELSNYRKKESRADLEDERQTLLNTLCPSVIRLMILTAHLDGNIIPQLNLERIFSKHNDKFKTDLDDARIELREQFEALK